MHKPWYSYISVRSPIVKILLGVGTLLATLALLAFQWGIEEPRMQAQSASWDGRSIEQGAAIFANNCTTCHGPDGKGLPGVAPALNSAYFFTNRLSDVGFAGSQLDYIEGTVAAGRPANAISQWAQKMPTWGQAYGGPMRDDQVHNVSLYVMNWKESALLQTPEEDPWQPFQNAVTTAVSGTVTAGSAAAPSGEPRDPETLFTLMACGSCHMEFPTANQTPDNKGVIAPFLGNLDERAGTTVPGQDAETYVHTSIVDPNAHIAAGYPSPSAMPGNFAERMSDDEIWALARWVLEQAAAN